MPNKKDPRRPAGDTGIAEIYTADKGQPPMDPDMGSARPSKKPSPKLDPRRPRGDTGIADIYTEDKGQPPMEPDMGSAKPVKKMAKGGSASSRGDGIAQRGKTKGRMV